MFKEVFPPAGVQRAIESKEAQQQEAEAMKFRLQRERLEVECLKGSRISKEAKGDDGLKNWGSFLENQFFALIYNNKYDLFL